MTVVDGNTLDGVSATTLWTLHNRAGPLRRRRPSMTQVDFG